jgi:hypothetical protein
MAPTPAARARGPSRRAPRRAYFINGTGAVHYCHFSVAGGKNNYRAGAGVFTGTAGGGSYKAFAPAE